jgi:cytidine deaminase
VSVEKKRYQAMKTMNPHDVQAKDLVAAAIAARDRAYAPYSGYAVGAAVLTDDGRTFAGCNVENAVYPLTLCAERVAIAKAISEGARRVVAVAVATANAGTPCGSCRQVMQEFGVRDMPVYVADLEGSYTPHTLAHLLPESFSAASLEVPTQADPGDDPA